MPHIPKDPHAEEAVIASILIDPELLNGAIQSGLSSESFSEVKCAIAFEGLVALSANNQEVSSVSLMVWLRDSGNAHKLTVSGVSQLSGAVETTLGFPTALNSVINKHAQRKALMEARLLVQKLEEDYLSPDDLDNAIAPPIARITNAVKRQEAARSIDQIAQDALANLEKRQSGADLGGQIHWGIPVFDRYASAIEKHEIVVIAARPSIGKSSLARQVGWHNVKAGKRVAAFLLETSDVSFVEGCAAQEARVNVKKIREEPIDKVNRFRDELHRIKRLSNLKIYDHDMTLAAIESRLRVLHTAWRPELVIVDYLQIIRRPSSNKSTADEIGNITSAFMSLVKLLGCPIILLSQLNRESEKQNREPGLSDLRDSGTIEQDAHRVVFIHRKSQDPSGNSQMSDVYRTTYYSKLIQSKLRDGPKTASDVLFRAPYATFEDDTNKTNTEE